MVQAPGGTSSTKSPTKAWLGLSPGVRRPDLLRKVLRMKCTNVIGLRRRRMDLVIHAPNRPRICAALAAAEAVEFAVLRDFLEVSGSVLSKHLSTLDAAGYISTKREVRARHSRVWALSPKG